MNVKLKLLSTGVIFFTGGAIMAQVDSTKIKNIEEVVVVAYGKQTRETIVGSNVQVKSETFEKRAVTNISSAIDGAAPGIQVAAGSGQPGSSASIRIRGFSSATTSFSGANAPLYVVDGVIFNGSLASINPNDIESFNILKDAASTSLYGSNAANGVIIITTKKGKKGRHVVNFSSSIGFSMRGIPEYDRISADQYYPIVWESIRNGYITSNPTATVATANTYASSELINILKNNIYNVPNNQVVTNGVLNPNAVKKYNDFNWEDILFNTGARYNYDLNYSGGTEKSTFYAALGYLNETGYSIGSDYERFTGRVSADSQLTNWLKAGVNIFASGENSNNAYQDDGIVNPYSWSRNIGPIYSPYVIDDNGNRVIGPDGEPLYDYESTRGARAYTGRNAIYESILNTSLTKTNNMNARAYAEAKFLKDFKFTFNGAYDTRNTYNRSYTNKILGDAAPGGAASRTSTNQFYVTLNQILNYNRRFGQHQVEAILGHENNLLRYEYFYGRRTDQVASGNDDLINFVTTTSLTSTTDNYRKEAYFSRVNYNYNEKYLLSASLRTDASSKFAPENRWEQFWSVGAGWNAHKESFLRNIRFIDELKFRGSYGEVGNENPVNYYGYQSSFELGFNNSGEAGVAFGIAADPNIKWESNNQTDIALDFGFLDRRISGSFEWYKRETEGLLFSVPSAYSSGYPTPSVVKNVGSMYNRGLEMSLNLGIIRNSNFSWDLTINASTLKNEITKLFGKDDDQIINGTKKLTIGSSIYDYWLRQWYGVDSNNGDGLFLLDDEKIATAPAGSYQLNGVWVTNKSADAKYDYSGSSIPDVFGSLNNVFRYKNISLQTLITYQFGGKIYDGNYAALMSGFAEGSALHTDISKRWQKSGDVTDVPRLDNNSYAQYGVASTRWLIDADYVSIRSATLTYNFNDSFLRPIGLSSARMYVSGENLYSFTKRKGLEPAEEFNGTTSSGRFLPARIISLGFNVSF